MKPRIMYIEYKGTGLDGPGRIGRVTFSKTGRTLRCAGKEFRTLDGTGYKANYRDTATGEEYWISGPKKNGRDRLYGGIVEIDEDVRDEYWCEIRKLPQNRQLTRYRAGPPD